MLCMNSFSDLQCESETFQIHVHLKLILVSLDGFNYLLDHYLTSTIVLVVLYYFSLSFQNFLCSELLCHIFLK